MGCKTWRTAMGLSIAVRRAMAMPQCLRMHVPAVPAVMKDSDLRQQVDQAPVSGTSRFE